MEVWKVAALNISLRTAGRANAGAAARDREASAVCLSRVGRMREAMMSVMNVDAHSRPQWLSFVDETRIK